MAQEEAQERLYEYLTSKHRMKALFGISMTDDDFVEDSYFIFRDLGNVATAVHGFTANIDQDGFVDLPCNFEYIEAVSEGSTADFSDDDLVILYGDPTTITITASYSFLPDVVSDPSFKRHNLSRSDLHPKGDFVPYEIDASGTCKKLRFDKKFVGNMVTVIYRGILMDSDQNPLLTRKEVEAIAYKMAFLVTQKKAFMGDDQSTKFLPYIKPEAERMAAAAKIPEYLSQNFLDRLLSAKTRSDRKVFYSSYKTLE